MLFFRVRKGKPAVADRLAEPRGRSVADQRILFVQFEVEFVASLVARWLLVEAQEPPYRWEVKVAVKFKARSKDLAIMRGQLRLLARRVNYAQFVELLQQPVALEVEARYRSAAGTRFKAALSD